MKGASTVLREGVWEKIEKEEEGSNAILFQLQIKFLKKI